MIPLLNLLLRLQLPSLQALTLHMLHKVLQLQALRHLQVRKFDVLLLNHFGKIVLQCL